MITQRVSNRGFTLLELLVVIAIIGILAAVVIASVSQVKRDSFVAKSQQEMRSVYNSLLLYQLEYGEFPPDTSRNVPSGLEKYLASGQWPEAPWPKSVYDWDNWMDPDNPGEQILQISVRFCPAGQLNNCLFPQDDWAENFDGYSAVYYCIQGACRSHISRPIDHPGYCINCSN